MAIDQHERPALEGVWRKLDPGRRDESRIGLITPEAQFRVSGTPVDLIGVSEPSGSNSLERIRVGVFAPAGLFKRIATDEIGKLDAAVLVRLPTEEEMAESQLGATNQRVAELLGNLSRETGDLVILERLGPKEIFAVV